MFTNTSWLIQNDEISIAFPLGYPFRYLVSPNRLGWPLTIGSFVSCRQASQAILMILTLLALRDLLKDFARHSPWQIHFFDIFTITFLFIRTFDFFEVISAGCISDHPRFFLEAWALFWVVFTVESALLPNLVF